VAGNSARIAPMEREPTQRAGLLEKGRRATLYWDYYLVGQAFQPDFWEVGLESLTSFVPA
jgi:hypothetical protein